ncbi:MAG: hypothetical protein KAH07_02630 [Flavobacteriaceae bacterium]|nr:hypothetical protein [Flavobacteriaceae bacterium]
MSVYINYTAEKVVATFPNNVKKNEVRDVFLEIISTAHIDELKLLVLDFTTTTSYVIPKDFMIILKAATKFSSNWNPDVKVIIIATNPEVRQVTTTIINHQEELYWKYLLYTDIKSAKESHSGI